MMRNFVCIMMALLLTAGLYCEGHAALKSSKNQGESKPEDAYNPHEDVNDLELPMPNGQKLILRSVPIASNGPFEDKEFNMGLRNLDENRAVYERSMPAYIGAPFQQENMPKEWQGKFPPEEKKNYTYYMIGKYELTNGQWAAVMDEEVEGRPELPKTGISWYDIQDFLRKYNEWLLRNHPDSVPTIDGVPAFVRIPTETEWEYAARWGNPEEQQKNPDFPGLGEDNKVEDFAIFGSRYDDKMPIGSRLPNKLGIYDMAGNVAELVQSGFRFPVARNISGVRITTPHGSEGGLVRKGGSYQDAEEYKVYPGRREELRMFEKTQDNSFAPHKTGTLGVRLALGSPNMPGKKREDMILAEARKNDQNPLGSKSQPVKAAPKVQTGPGQEAVIVIDVDGDPETELEKIYAATQSPLIKSNLAQFRELIRGQNEALNRERSANLLGLIRQGAYKADSLANIAFRCYQLDHEIEKVKNMSDQKVPPELEKKVRAQIQRHFRNLQVSTNLYRQSVEEAAAYPKEVIDEKLVQLRKEYGGEDQLNKLFRNNLEGFAKHVDYARKNGINKLNNTMIWKSAIPHETVYTLVSNLENGGKNSKKRN